AYLEGRGSVIIRAKTHVEEPRKDRFAIVVDEIPYQVNKSVLIERIAELAKEKRVDGISSVQDESDRHGVRVVIELKRDATPDVVLNQLFRFTSLQTTFGCNMLALNGGKPEQLALRDFLTHFIAFREEVVARRTAYELRRARERSHVLCGLAVAVSNVDEVVATIRSSADAAEARERLMARRWSAHEIAEYLRLIDDPLHPVNEDGTYNLSEVQARAILDLRLQRLTQIGVKEVTDELQTLADAIRDYLAILASRERVMGIIAAELREVRDLFAVPRRTQIVDWSGDMMDEDLIEREDMVVTITSGGYIKRTALAEFRSQRRGGKGLSGMATKEDDVVTTLFVANTHTELLFFTTDGMVYRLKTWRLPLGGRTSKGKAIVNILPIEPGVSIAALLPMDAPEAEWDRYHVVFATSQGDVRRNALSDFTNIMRNGKIAMRLPEGVSLIGVRLATDEDDIILVTARGRAIRFPVTDLRVFQSRNSTGVRGIRLADGDSVVSMAVIRHFEADPAERAAYLKMRRAVAGALDDGAELDEDEDNSEGLADGTITQERYAEKSAAEDLILTITARGAGKISSSHDYPVRGRGGQGVMAMDRGMRGGPLVAAFPVEPGDQIMLATSTGQSIRVPVDGISFRSRSAGGVRVFNTANGEVVVSVARIAEQAEPDDMPDAGMGMANGQTPESGGGHPPATGRPLTDPTED
ncbi:MAG: DNA gyrase C-terminal beta-propeller domain-containing protein, partial [Paracoccus sp. (in: a-proteobacteria)]|nr:DNA gyrase C-terminal beta-propeller domain-containing protein [Paracoccus sp. (in: a-proteobacteria)]